MFPRQENVQAFYWEQNMMKNKGGEEEEEWNRVFEREKL